MIVTNSFKNATWIEVLFAAESHGREQNLKLMDEFHSGINQLFVQFTLFGSFLGLLRGRVLCLLLIFGLFVFWDLLDLEVEDLRYEAGQGVVNLQQRVEVACVTDVAKSGGLIFLS